MTTYSVYLPPIHQPDLTDQEFRLVPDTKAPLALVFPPFWLAVKGLWLELFAWFVITVLILLLAVSQPGILVGYLSALPGFYLLLEGHELVRRKLEREGWQFSGVVEGDDAEEAEIRFVHDNAADLKKQPVTSRPATIFHPPAGNAVGLFPE